MVFCSFVDLNLWHDFGDRHRISRRGLVLLYEYFFSIWSVESLFNLRLLFWLIKQFLALISILTFLIVECGHDLDIDWSWPIRLYIPRVFAIKGKFVYDLIPGWPVKVVLWSIWSEHARLWSLRNRSLLVIIASCILYHNEINRLWEY